jgi:hypothetical protein
MMSGKEWLLTELIHSLYTKDIRSRFYFVSHMQMSTPLIIVVHIQQFIDVYFDLSSFRVLLQ